MLPIKAHSSTGKAHRFFFKCTLLQIDFTLLSGCQHLCLSVAHETPSPSFAVKKFHIKKILRTMPLFKVDKGGGGGALSKVFDTDEGGGGLGGEEEAGRVNWADT